jgi:AraC-like DNA-binding protein
MSECLSAKGLECGAPALKRLRAATSDICEVVPRTDEDDFHVSHATRVIDGALLADSFTTRLEYDRTPAHVARGGLDHYQVALCLQGEMQFTSGRRELTMRRGDVCLIDMAQPSRIVLTEADDDRTRVMSLVLPRAVLAPKLAYPDSATASFLPGSGSHGCLLASQFATFWQPDAPEAGSPTATIEAMIDIVAAAAGCAADANGKVSRAERHLYLAMIKRHIESNLETEAVAPTHLCRRFRISRASLYRLFEAEGGLACYVRERRLNRALMMLISPTAPGERLIDLAVSLQFSSASTFIRAFRRQFGMTPGEIRELSQVWLRETGAVPVPDGLLHQLARR